jgi:hypothetical protein
MVLPLAHVGHWLANVMYVAPVVLIVAWLAVQAMRDRRAERREAADSPTAEDDR